MLTPGEVVEVRSAAEILETLDTDGALLNGMPFMPEMTVARQALHRRPARREDLRHRERRASEQPQAAGLRAPRGPAGATGRVTDGCQAGCRIYWKEAWLRRVDSAGPATTADAGGDGLDKLGAAGECRHADGA